MTRTLKTFLSEAYLNLFSKEDKEKYADEVWEILTSSYKAVGGLHGNGFGSKEEMIKSIPFWKLVRRDGKIICVTMYKDNGGRKGVASGTDGSAQGKQELKKILETEFTRSYKEISGPAERFVQKNLPDLYDKYKIPYEKVSEILGKEISPPDKPDGYHYKREIGGEMVEKIMLGTPGKKIVPKEKK